MCLRQRIKKEVFIEYWVPAILDNGAPLFLLLARVQVECHATVDALNVRLPVINGFGREHAHPQTSRLPVVMRAEPQSAPLVEDDRVLALQEV